MAKPPVAEQVQVNFRMPVALRDRIKRKAEADGVSMNAAIIDALERSFPPPLNVNDVVDDVVSVLMYVEPGLRERAIAELAKKAENGRLSLLAEAYVAAEKDMGRRFPWEND